MHPKRWLPPILLAASAACASGSRPGHALQRIEVRSAPSGCVVAVDCGPRVSNRSDLRTPAEIEVDRADVPCRIRISRFGYRTAEIELGRRRWIDAQSSAPAARRPDQPSRGMDASGAQADLLFPVLAGVALAIDSATGEIWERFPNPVVAELEWEGAPAAAYGLDPQEFAGSTE
jgi:hypothetical protein